MGLGARDSSGVGGADSGTARAVGFSDRSTGVVSNDVDGSKKQTGSEVPMSIVSLLVALVVICLVFWAVNAILRAFGVGDPIATIVKVVLVVVVILWILSALGVGTGLRLR
jgi:hypothetical protein